MKRLVSVLALASAAVLVTQRTALADSTDVFTNPISP
jgi:hypothetical protein